MDKKIKDYIAENKLSDDEILKRLTAEPKPAEEEEVEENADEESDVEEDAHEEESDVEEDATTEQPDIGELVKTEVAKALKSLKGGKKPPKTTKKPKPRKKVYNYNQEFGEL